MRKLLLVIVGLALIGAALWVVGSALLEPEPIPAAQVIEVAPGVCKNPQGQYVPCPRERRQGSPPPDILGWLSSPAQNPLDKVGRTIGGWVNAVVGCVVLAGVLLGIAFFTGGLELIQ